MIPFPKEEDTPPVTNMNLLMYLFYLITGYKGNLDILNMEGFIDKFFQKKGVKREHDRCALGQGHRLSSLLTPFQKKT